MFALLVFIDQNSSQSVVQDINRYQRENVVNKEVSVENVILQDDLNTDNILLGAQEKQDNNDHILKQYIFVEDAYSNNVIVIDTDGNIVKRIKTGRNPHDIAVSPDNRYVATANFSGNSVSIIDTAKLEKIADVYTGLGAHGVVFDRSGKYLYVVNSLENTMSIIEIESLPDINTKKIYVNKYPEYVGVTYDNKYIFIVNLSEKGLVTVLRNKGFDSEVEKTVYLNTDTHGFSISPDSNMIVFTNMEGRNVFMVSGDDFAVRRNIDVKVSTELAAFKTDNEIWMTNIYKPYVYIYDLLANKITGRIRVGSMPHGVFFNRNRNMAVVPLYDSGYLVFLDTNTRKEIKRVNIGKNLHNAVVVDIMI